MVLKGYFYVGVSLCRLCFIQCLWHEGWFWCRHQRRLSSGCAGHSRLDRERGWCWRAWNLCSVCGELSLRCSSPWPVRGGVCSPSATAEVLRVGPKRPVPFQCVFCPKGRECWSQWGFCAHRGLMCCPGGMHSTPQTQPSCIPPLVAVSCVRASRLCDLGGGCGVECTGAEHSLGWSWELGHLGWRNWRGCTAVSDLGCLCSADWASINTGAAAPPGPYPRPRTPEPLCVPGLSLLPGPVCSRSSAKMWCGVGRAGVLPCLDSAARWGGSHAAGLYPVRS